MPDQRQRDHRAGRRPGPRHCRTCGGAVVDPDPAAGRRGAGGVSEKTIATKAYQTTVTLTKLGSDPFTLVADDLVYPAPSALVGDTYVFYIGFDPQALKPEPKPRATKKK